MSLLGSYRIIDQLGEGSFATVFLGEEINSNELYAIKVITSVKSLPDNVLANIEQEVNITSSFKHPNLVQLHNVFLAEDGSRCLVLDYCPGGDLKGFLIANGRLSERQTLHFFEQIVDGVAYLHSKDCMHRDLKPANILLCEHSTQIKLADFGFTRYLPNQDLANTFCGSPLYMAPEVLHCLPYGKEVDLWSLGCIFYEMIVGHCPFTAYDIHRLLQVIMTQSLIKPAGMQLSDTSWGIIEKLLKISASDRLPIGQLQAMLKSESVSLTDGEDCQCSSSQSPSSAIPHLLSAVDSVSSEKDDGRQQSFSFTDSWRQRSFSFSDDWKQRSFSFSDDWRRRSFSFSDDGFQIVEAQDARVVPIKDILDETDESDYNLHLRNQEQCLTVVNAIINSADQYVCHERTCAEFFRTQNDLALDKMSHCDAYDAMKNCCKALSLYFYSFELLKCYPLSPSSWCALPSRVRADLQDIYASIVERSENCEHIINFLLVHRSSYAISTYELPRAEKVILELVRYKKTVGYAHIDMNELRIARYEFWFALRLLEGLSMLATTEFPISCDIKCDLEDGLLKLAQLPKED